MGEDQNEGRSRGGASSRVVGTRWFLFTPSKACAVGARLLRGSSGNRTLLMSAIVLRDRYERYLAWYEKYLGKVPQTRSGSAR